MTKKFCKLSILIEPFIILDFGGIVDIFLE